MKKLLALALGSTLVFSLAAASMAATTVGGELNFGYKNTPAAQGDWGNVKISTTAKLNDEVTGFAAFKADPGIGTFAGYPQNTTNLNTPGYPFVDEAWIKLHEGFGTIQTGLFAYNVKDNLDILGGVMGYLNVPAYQTNYGVMMNGDQKSNAAVRADFNLMKNLSAYGWVAVPNDDAHYAVGVAYNTAKFGGDVNYAMVSDHDTAIDKNYINPVIAANAFYAPIDSAKVFVHYGITKNNTLATDNDIKSAVIGALYDSAKSPLYGRVEYDLNKGAYNNDRVHPWGVRIGYKLSNNVKLEAERAQNDFVNGGDYTQVKMNMTF